MPLHKTNRGSRLDPTMISAPLGDFRHTMHIGRGGDVFGDTSFLSNHGPSSPSTNSVASPLPCISPEPVLNSEATSKDTPQPCELQHSESVSSLSLDLDFDLGPSILGDVLGVMDGLALDSAWTTAGVGEDYSSSKSVVKVEELGRSGKESFLSVKNDSNVQDVSMLKKNADWEISDESSLKSKAGGFRPKVRFSDKREEIIGQEDEIEELEQDTNELECVIPSVGECKKGNCTVSYPLRGQDRVGEATNHVADSQPSPASSHSSEFESLTPLDRRREDNHLTESESEEEGEGDEQGYTFEDEFDDEIGL